MFERTITDRDEWLGWRKVNINASEAAALFGAGIHPYTSAYQLWAERSGLRRPSAGETKAMRRGNLFEDDAVELAQEEKPDWEFIEPRVYIENKEWRIGATPDRYYRRPETAEIGNFQVKTIGKWAFEHHWKDPDTREITPPLWVAIQASIEAIMAGCSYSTVGAMVITDAGICDMHILDVPLKAGLMTSLRPLVADFWRRVEENDPYPIDWKADANAVMDVYRDSDGSQVDLTGDSSVEAWLNDRERLKEAEREGAAAEKQRKLIDKQLIARLGNAEVGRFGDRIIKAATIYKEAYSVKASQYRQVRIK